MARSNRSRTVTTLAALVAAMGVGAFVLIMMEKPPARPPAALRADAADGSGAAADPNQSRTERAALVRRTDVPIQPIKWRNIVLYGAADNPTASPMGQAPTPQAPGGCHFLIGTAGANSDGTVRSTGLWRQQLDGNHCHGGRHPYNNENSIGIRLFCDTDISAPTSGQMSALTDLVRVLQAICRIPSDRVYIYTGPDRPGRLGRFFPLETFRSRLLTTRR